MMMMMIIIIITSGYMTTCILDIGMKCTCIFHVDVFFHWPQCLEDFIVGPTVTT